MLPSSSYVPPRRLLGALPPPVGSPDGTVESDAVIILAALLCTLICVVGLGVMARCAWRCRTSNSESSSNSSSNKGLKKKALRAIPVAVFSSVGEKLASDCAICLTEFVAGEKVRVLPVCGHCFHLPCIDTWLSAHSSCPSCRQILPENGLKAKPSVQTARRCERCGLPENCPPVIIPGNGGDGGV